MSGPDAALEYGTETPVEPGWYWVRVRKDPALTPSIPQPRFFMRSRADDEWFVIKFEPDVDDWVGVRLMLNMFAQRYEWWPERMLAPKRGDCNVTGYGADPDIDDAAEEAHGLFGKISKHFAWW